MKGEFHFTSNVVRYFTISVRKLFHIRRKPNISLLVAVLFTFCRFYGIIQLIDKLEFVGGFANGILDLYVDYGFTASFYYDRLW